MFLNSEKAPRHRRIFNFGELDAVFPRNRIHFAIYKEKSNNLNVAFSNLTYSEFCTLGVLQPKKSRIPYYPTFLSKSS